MLIADIDLPTLAVFQREIAEPQQAMADEIRAFWPGRDAYGTRAARGDVIAKADAAVQTGRILDLMARHDERSMAFLAVLIADEASKPVPSPPRLVVHNRPPQGRLARRLSSLGLWLGPRTKPQPTPSIEPVAEVA